MSLTIPTFISSCRQESDTLIQPSEEQVLEPNSKTTSLMAKVTLNDGSIDNIIDNSSCFTVQLPITVAVDGNQLVIASTEDYLAIEELLLQNNSDQVVISFPITLIFSNYEEVIVESSEELSALIEACTPPLEEDDNPDDDDDDDEEVFEDEDEDIECIDFQYPFNITVFNPDTEILETIRIESDEELFAFVSDLNDDVIANISFPITLVLSDESELVVNSNEELEIAIEEASDDCDDNDTTILQLESVIVEDEWEVQKYKDNQSNETRNYRNFIFTFNPDRTALVRNTDTDEEFVSQWSAFTRADGSLRVQFDFGDEPPLDKLNIDWNVKKIKTNRIMLDEREGEGISKDELFFRKVR